MQEYLLNILKKNKLYWMTIPDIQQEYYQTYGYVSRTTISTCLARLMNKKEIKKKRICGNIQVVYQYGN